MIAYTEQLYSGTATASGDTYTTPILVKYAKEASIFFKVTAASGSSPTLDVVVMEYDPRSDDWYILATFSQKTGTGTDVGYVEYGLGEKMAINYVIGGTTPSFTFQVNATLKEA
jgi:hypothetical protein